jgi:hypothetical protein
MIRFSNALDDVFLLLYPAAGPIQVSPYLLMLPIKIVAFSFSFFGKTQLLEP